LHIELAGKIADIRIQEILPVRRGSTHRVIERCSLHALQDALQQCVGLGLDPFRDLLIRRAAAGRVV
jgi:hypothetical protein